MTDRTQTSTSPTRPTRPTRPRPGHDAVTPGDRPVLPRVLVFLALAYALTWWVVPFGSDSFPVFPYGPDAALLVVVLATTGRAGMRRLGANLRRWRASPTWYAFALLVPTGIGLAAALATTVTGAPSSAMPTASSGVEFVVVLPIMILVGGALGEELGWRGYALPLLQRRCAPLLAVGLVFVAHAVWHLPLFFTSEPPAIAPFLIELAAGGVVLAWMMNSTRVIWLPILLHGAHNMSQQAFMSDLSGSDLVAVQWFTAGGWAVLAVVVVVATRGRLVTGASGPLVTPMDEQENVVTGAGR